jgi:enoyl-CoA hydratase/carnithine racemase
MPGTIHLVVEAGVAHVTLDSPDKLNAISIGMWSELRSVFTNLAADESLRCVIVRGAGGNFAAGADIEEFTLERHDEASGRRYHLDLIGPTLSAITHCPVPVIAAIEGVCVGGGLEVAVSCDIRIARDDARFGVPVGRIGFPLALPEMVPLLQLVGPGVAAELLLANRLLGAPEALAKGLVQQVLPEARFEAALAELRRGVLAGSPLAARLNKAQIRMLLEQRMRYTQHDLDASFAFFTSADYKEGIAAFLAKRPPQFTGR